MKRSPGTGFAVFLLAFSLATLSGSPAHSQAVSGVSSAQVASAEAPPEGETSRAPAAGKEQPKAADSASEEEGFRHSANVQKLAGFLHLSIETTARICEFINFGIIAFSILYFVFKLIPKYFGSRKEAIQKQLVDARSATEVANERLQGVEQRLARLDQDIEAIRKQVEQDTIQDESRIKAALEEERLRIVDSAGHEIEAAAAAAHRDLKRFAAELAIDRATSQLSLTPENDRELVQGFARSLGNKNNGGRN